ncbi:MAG: cobalt ECF transporter T component CbiQ [Deltaproteobacteria bacterium]|jgi:cobalt/nickel transport system permease protein|nr:cobalt ECF transporter T component CbiQ [Deltaproteobacteria bacterium]
MTPPAVADRAWLSLSSLDPAYKLPAALLFAVLSTSLQTLTAGLCACLFALGLALAGGLPPIGLGRKLAPVNFFFLFLWIFLPLSLSAPDATGAATPDTLLEIGPLCVRQSGLLLALSITLKGNAIALAVLALAGSSSLNAHGRALLRLHVPAKLVTLMLLTHGNIQLLRREAGHLYRAAKLRGFTPAASLWSYRVAAYLAAMLLLRSWERTERVALAMRLRGFTGTFPLPETEAHPPADRIKARLLAGVVAGAGLCILTLDRGLLQKSSPF